MRYFIEFAYDGTDFHGSQTQPNGNTVQAEMEAAFATILREPVALTFAGRTDAGVHAEKMVAHFDVAKALPVNFAGRLNNLLPCSIAISGLRRVQDDAHARFDALERSYYYRITTRKEDDREAGFCFFLPHSHGCKDHYLRCAPSGMGSRERDGMEVCHYRRPVLAEHGPRGGRYSL